MAKTMMVDRRQDVGAMDWERWTQISRVIKQGPFIRGTKEWDKRERARARLGCKCLSWGRLK